jgi:type II secretory pathway pseudopilin PulG
MIRRLKIAGRRSERGFTLVESLLVIGLTTLVTAGVVAGLLEGMDALRQMTDRQTAEYGHQRAMQMFVNDVQSAQWFYNGTVHDESEATVPRDQANQNDLLMGYTGPDGEDVWIRYRVKFGAFSGESYLCRTLWSSAGEEGLTLLSSGVANLEFNYLDSDGGFTDVLSSVKRIRMTLSVDIAGSSVLRVYEAVMRNGNEGVKVVPVDFNEIESKYFNK